MPTIPGVNFGREFSGGGGGPEILETQGRTLAEKIHHQNLLRHLPAIFNKWDLAICVTVRLLVQCFGGTMYWQADANTPLSVSNTPH